MTNNDAVHLAWRAVECGDRRWPMPLLLDLQKAGGGKALHWAVATSRKHVDRIAENRENAQFFERELQAIEQAVEDNATTDAFAHRALELWYPKASSRSKADLVAARLWEALGARNIGNLKGYIRSLEWALSVANSEDDGSLDRERIQSAIEDYFVIRRDC